MIDVDQAEVDKKYEEYVFNKLKIKICPILMDETTLRKRLMYRSASAEAVLRHQEYINLKSSFAKIK